MPTVMKYPFPLVVSPLRGLSQQECLARRHDCRPHVGKIDRGDFSASRNAILDPLTGQAFPGNQIPSSRFNSVSAKVLHS